MGSNVGSDIGSNPQAFVIRFSLPTFISILRNVSSAARTKSRKQKDRSFEGRTHGQDEAS